MQNRPEARTLLAKKNMDLAWTPSEEVMIALPNKHWTAWTPEGHRVNQRTRGIEVLRKKCEQQVLNAAGRRCKWQLNM